ncbi:hypothetical protein GCM10022212_06020 [Actimicrobium antarcticum]|uniref:Uncharacterized protein n=1 Tax=Actimicrobium antarcticum TaxID=1051899 RepID=A0ABP7SPN4_9BURK
MQPEPTFKLNEIVGVQCSRGKHWQDRRPAGKYSVALRPVTGAAIGKQLRVAVYRVRFRSQRFNEPMRG